MNMLKLTLLTFAFITSLVIPSNAYSVNRPRPISTPVGGKVPQTPWCSAANNRNCPNGCLPDLNGGRCRSGTGGGGGTPVGTPTPAIGWYGPGGEQCNRTNYHAYYALSNCSGKPSFVTEGITPQSDCSTNGSGKCYGVTGTASAQLSKSFWKLDAQSCTALAIPIIPQNAYDTLYTCRYGIPPDSTINGSVTATYTNINQFEKLYVWAVDSQVGFTKNFEIPKSAIVNNQPQPYNFDNLFPDKKYDVFVKAYGPKGVYLDKVNYTGSCGSPGCRSYPNAQLDFKITFPQLAAGSLTGQVSNEVFQRMIDQWINGNITPVQMSQFIAQIGRAPGLQKATCDPLVGGCNP